MFSEDIDAEFRVGGTKNQMAKDGVGFVREWLKANNFSEDIAACDKYVTEKLEEKYSSIIMSVFLSIIVNLVVKFIINKLFTRIRDDEIKNSHDVVVEVVEDQDFTDYTNHYESSGE